MRLIRFSTRCVRSVSTCSTRSSGTLTGCRAARANSPFLAALASAARSADTQMPRPGSFSAGSGAIWPSGPITNRISPCFGCTSPVAMHLRSGPSIRSLGCPPRPIRCLRGLIESGLCLRVVGLFNRRLQIGRVDPAKHDACRHDHILRLFERDVKLLQNAFVLDALAVLGGPASGQFPIGAGGEILERFDVILGQRLHHLGCQSLEFNEAILDAKLARLGE